MFCNVLGGIYGILRLGRLATLHRKKNQVSQSLDFEILLFQPPNAGVSSLHRHAQQLCLMFSLLVVSFVGFHAGNWTQSLKRARQILCS